MQGNVILWHHMFYCNIIIYIIGRYRYIRLIVLICQETYTIYSASHSLSRGKKKKLGLDSHG
jgi:hypothetical protein